MGFASHMREHIYQLSVERRSKLALQVSETAAVSSTDSFKLNHVVEPVRSKSTFSFSVNMEPMLRFASAAENVINDPKMSLRDH